MKTNIINEKKIISENKKSKLSKNLEKFYGTVNKEYTSLKEIIDTVKSNAFGKFKESIDVALKLKKPKKKGVLPVKGMMFFPHSISNKDVKIAVFTSPGSHENLKLAGADRVGEQDLIDDVLADKVDYDYYLASNDMVTLMSKVAKKLGPKGKLPSKKNETMTDDLVFMIEKLKKGVVYYKEDKSKVIHAKIGLVSMDTEKIEENFKILLQDLAKQSTENRIKDFFISIHISSTMGGSIKIPFNKIESIVK